MKEKVKAIKLLSFRRKPESSNILQSLDPGLRRDDISSPRNNLL